MVRPRAETLILDIEKSDLLSRSVHYLSNVRYVRGLSDVLIDRQMSMKYLLLKY